MCWCITIQFNPHFTDEKPKAYSVLEQSASPSIHGCLLSGLSAPGVFSEG